MSFATTLQSAIGRKKEGVFDGQRTVDAAEAQALVKAIDETPLAARQTAVDAARQLMDSPSNFADRRALEVLRTGLFKGAPALSRLDADGWRKHGAKIGKAWGQLPGRVSVVYPAANGGRPVLVFIPRDLDPEKPVRLSTYFHGRLGDLSSEYPALIRRVAEVAPRSQTVFVFPQGWMHMPADAWMDPAAGESFAGLEAAAIAEATRSAGRPLAITGRTVTAHSNGGFAVANAARSGELKADRLQLYDCFYESDGVRSWETIGDWAAAQKPELTVITATNDRARNEEFSRRTGAKIDAPGLGHGEIPSRRFVP